MSIIQGNAKQASTRGFYSFPIEQSLRFNDDDTAYLSWTPASAGNRKTWTWSGWVKRGDLSRTQGLFGAGVLGNNANFQAYWNSNNTLYFQETVQNVSNQLIWASTPIYRDVSAWYHVVIAMDTTQITAENRAKVYVNGVQITGAFSVTPTQNQATSINNNVAQYLGSAPTNTASLLYLDGYMAEVNFIDGTALDADSFGELKNGVWIPKDPSGLTYGTNGFRLSFADDAEVEAFNTVLYRGNGGTQSVTGMGFEPDLVWIKSRNHAHNPEIYDSVRGPQKGLMPSTTNAEFTRGVTSFDSDGFSLDTSIYTNQNALQFVGWGWKAGDSNVSNTDGSITSTVRANDTYGFSIVSYTGNGTAGATVGHGLSSAPDFVVTKRRNSTGNWFATHSSLSSDGKVIYLNLTNAEVTSTPIWNDTAPDASTFTLGNGNSNNSGGTFIAYCWAEKAGYSKFGTFTGNGSSTGPSVTTGFLPSIVIYKRIDAASDWWIIDSTRDTEAGNPSDVLFPNKADAELETSDWMLFTSTGFQLSGRTDSNTNGSGGTYIYAAFADTREAAFWLDQSGNDNDWQPVNLDHNDTVADSPTNNFATLNPLNLGGGTLSDGNLNWSISSSTGLLCTATMAFDIESVDNKYYWEVTLNSGQTVIGIAPTTLRGSDTGRAGSYGYYVDGNKYSGVTPSSYGAAYTSGDTIGVAVGAGKITFYKNGVSQGDAFTGLTGTFVPFIAEVTCNVTANFGQQPFKYDPPA